MNDRIDEVLLLLLVLQLLQLLLLLLLLLLQRGMSVRRARLSKKCWS